MIVFVAAILSVLSDLVVLLVVVVVRIGVGRAIHILELISVQVFCDADLGSIGQLRIGSGGSRQSQRNIDGGGGSGRKRSGQRDLRGSGVGSGHPRGIGEFHTGGQVIGYDNVLSRNGSLINDGDRKGSRIARADAGTLTGGQLLDEGQVKGLYGHFGGVVVVFVTAIFTVAINGIVG